jgi:hypothetical protein
MQPYFVLWNVPGIQRIDDQPSRDKAVRTSPLAPLLAPLALHTER